MFPIKRIIKSEGPVLKQNETETEDGGKLEYLTFPSLEETGIVKHLFTTRLGGASEGEFSTMNLSFTRGDREYCVAENYRRIGRVLGCRPEDMTASHQTHTTNIRRVTAADRGKGITCLRDYENIDGLITDEPGIMLVTYYADCVPLFFVDTVHRAVGLAHSGWRGTAAGMGGCMVRAMEEAYETNPEDLFVAIGPSICADCYEVEEDAARYFRGKRNSGSLGSFCSQHRSFYEEFSSFTPKNAKDSVFHRPACWPWDCEIPQSGDMEVSKFPGVVRPGRRQGKYQLDLWEANRQNLLAAGVKNDRIAVTDICTCCNADYLFSHRASGGRRGNMGAFLGLKGCRRNGGM